MFEGARLIVGDGRPPIENAVIVVNGTRFTKVGRGGQVSVPAGATRVNLAGKTVMPAIIDMHTHLSQTREALTDDLRRRAYYGVSAAISPGQDPTDVSFQVRAQTMRGAAPRRSRLPVEISFANEGVGWTLALRAENRLARCWAQRLPNCIVMWGSLDG